MTNGQNSPWQRWPQGQRPDWPKVPKSAVIGVLLAVVLAAGAWTSLHAIPAEAVGVVQRFGEYIRTVEPGLRVIFPYGIERITVVPIRRQLKQEFGFGTGGGDNPTQYSRSLAMQELERAMVTGDLNAALVEWIVQYRIRDPKEFLFSVRHPGATLRDISESVMREIVGDRTVDEVITFGRQEIEAEALIAMQEVANNYNIGLSIDQVQLKNVNPPQAVQASFNEVNQAQQERERAINVANGEYNKAVPRARGQADQQISEAEGYAMRRINEARGDAGRFEALLAEYVKAPEVTQRRIYFETMQGVAPRIGQKVILDKDAKQLLPLLSLGQKVTP